MSFSKKDILGVLFLVLAVFMFLGLVSFSHKDPSFNNDVQAYGESSSSVEDYSSGFGGSEYLYSEDSVHNILGLFGSYSSELVLKIFGISSFAIPFALIITAIFMFVRSKKKSFPFNRLVLLTLVVLFASVSLQTIFGKINYGGAVFYSGGVIGLLGASLLVPYLSSVGTAIISVTATLLLFLYLIDVSVSTGSTILAYILYKGLVLPVKYMYRYSSKWISSFIIWSTNKLRKQETLNDTPAFKVRKTSIKKAVLKEDKKEDKKEEEIIQMKSFNTDYELPSVELLNKNLKPKSKSDIGDLKATAEILQSRLSDFDVEGEVVEVSPGPVITMYEFKPAPGVKINKVANLSADLALALGCGSVRVIAPIPGKSVIGIEIPNKSRETVYIRELIDSRLFKTAEKRIPLALGKDTEGNSYVEDLAKMPHLLVAGSTGSGKSVFINSLIASILYKFSPKEVRMIMVDPKMLELSIYEGIPHLLLPVVTESPKAAQALKWAVREMMNRYTLLASKNARSIDSYNAIAEEPIPYIVIIVDELADLMMVSSKEVEASITRLAQMARAAGIHLVLATQRPSVDVITGLIKANFPARIAFKVASKIDSRTILDTMGAEQLLGMGDMLFLPPGTARLERLHGAYVCDEEIKKLVDFVKTQGSPEYKIEILEDKDSNTDGYEDDVDELYDRAVNIVVETRKTSISYIQRRLGVGYNRAANIMEQMERNGVVSEELATGKREILLDA
jgi:DNA segregation ATPase FtsK/SpoIIIE, S-DNA-T family